MPAYDVELRAILQLPVLAKAKPSQRVDVFIKKVKFCCIICDFKNELAQVKLKDVKRRILVELTEFVEDSKGILSENTYGVCVAMFCENIFRTLPPKDPGYDPAEDDPIIDASWPHLRLVYTFFLRMLESPEFQPNRAKRYFNNEFVIRLVNIFCVDDPNEREHLKTILHRVYAKFLGLRSYIRKRIGMKLQEVAFEYLEFSGLPEILEVMGSIINGYVRPYKQEHVQFLFQILLPLHSVPKMIMFHPQLVYCVIQFVEKDSSLAVQFVKGFLKRWPQTSAMKETLFLGELEEIIDVLQPQEFVQLQRKIFLQLGKCIKSDNYQVAERALFYWENEYIVSLMENGSQEIFPILLPALLHASNFHWNRTIASLAADVVQKFITPDNEHFETVVTEVKKARFQEMKRRQLLDKKWEAVEEMAARKASGPSRVVPPPPTVKIKATTSRVSYDSACSDVSIADGAAHSSDSAESCRSRWCTPCCAHRKREKITEPQGQRPPVTPRTPSQLLVELGLTRV